MNTAAIKTDLLKKIESLNAGQLKKLYGVFENYFHANDDTELWDELTVAQKNEIGNSMKEADRDEVTPAKEVIGRLRKKYSLNG